MPDIEKSSGEADGGLEAPTTTQPTTTPPAKSDAPREEDAMDVAVAAVKESETPETTVEQPEAPVVETEDADGDAPVQPETAPAPAPVEALTVDPWAEIDALDETWKDQLAQLDGIIESAQAHQDLQRPVQDEQIELLKRWAQETGTTLNVTGAPAPAAPTTQPQAPTTPPADPNNVMGFMNSMRETVVGLQRDLATERAERASEKKKFIEEQRQEKVKRQKAQFGAAAAAMGAREDVHDILFDLATKLRAERPTLRDKPVGEVLTVLKEQYPSLLSDTPAAAPATPKPERNDGDRPLQPRRKRKPTGEREPRTRPRRTQEAPASSLSEAAKSFKNRANKEL